MIMVQLAIESVGLVVGSLAVACVLCGLLWGLFRLVGHPAWGPPLVILLVPMALLGWLPRGEFLDFTLIFALIAALPFWVEGRAWRERHAPTLWRHGRLHRRSARSSLRQADGA